MATAILLSAESRLLMYGLEFDGINLFDAKLSDGWNLKSAGFSNVEDVGNAAVEK